MAFKRKSLFPQCRAVYTPFTPKFQKFATQLQIQDFITRPPPPKEKTFFLPSTFSCRNCRPVSGSAQKAGLNSPLKWWVVDILIPRGQENLPPPLLSFAYRDVLTNYLSGGGGKLSFGRKIQEKNPRLVLFILIQKISDFGWRFEIPNWIQTNSQFVSCHDI